MDTSAVIQLSCQAAESVLRFRAVGFTRRPVIDLQSFRAAVTAQIEKVAKDRQHRFEVPLAEVVTYAGIGAARAARQWNGISHKENHVAIEWFRNCVCNLVSGVVSDVGQMAFEDQGMNACMYLEPDEYDPFDVPSYSPAVPVRKSTPYIPSRTHSHYGLERDETEQADDAAPVSSTNPATTDTTSPTTESPPLRHEIEKGYAALEQLAVQKDTSARADFIENTKRLRNVSEPVCDAETLETLLKRPAKRARHSTSAPERSCGQALAATEIPAKTPRNFFWTNDEVNILMTAREFGRNWTEIVHMLPRHTSVACQAKHRLVKIKEAKSNQHAPAVNEQSQNGEDQVLQEDVQTVQTHQKEHETTSANPACPSGFKAVNTDIGNHEKQGK